MEENPNLDAMLPPTLKPDDDDDFLGELRLHTSLCDGE
jgi:hypothetical protein